MPARTLAAVAAVAAFVPAFGTAEARAAIAPAGVLSQLGGRNGCVYDPRGGSAQGLHVDLPGRCSSAESLDGAYDVAVSPDGRNLYVGSFQADSISAFARHAGSGALTQVAGENGCLVEQPFQTACGAAPGLDGISGVAVSPDGRHVYAASYFAHALVGFARARDTGGLTPLDAGGCLAESEVEWQCDEAAGLFGAASVAVSPDGRHVYVAGTLGGTVAAFSRTPATGALTQLTGADGCVRDARMLVEGGDTCAKALGLDSASSVAVSPDGRSVYVTSFGSAAVAVFARNRATGALRPLAGTAGCLSELRLVPDCAPARALEGAFGVTVSPDGRNVYVATGFDRRLEGPNAGNGGFEASGVAIFGRNRTSGALRQLAGRAGCVSERPTGSGCTDGRALEGSLAVQISRDGRNAYVAAAASNAIAVFRRTPATGALGQLAGRAGCISETGTGGACRDGTGLWGASAVALSPDGRFAYAPGFFSSAVAVFGRAAPARRSGR